MKELVFLLEEQSSKVLIEGVLTRMNTEISTRFIVFEGKQDLEKQIVKKLKGYLNPDAVFIILRDQDSADCLMIKNNLKQKCKEANRQEAIVRIACKELESWYLADLQAVEKAFNKRKLAEKQNEKKFRNPDSLGSPSYELKSIVPEYQKVSGSRMISQFIDLNNSRSKSFYHFINSIKKSIN